MKCYSDVQYNRDEVNGTDGLPLQESIRVFRRSTGFRDKHYLDSPTRTSQVQFR